MYDFATPCAEIVSPFVSHTIIAEEEEKLQLWLDCKKNNIDFLTSDLCCVVLYLHRFSHHFFRFPDVLVIKV